MSHQQDGARLAFGGECGPNLGGGDGRTDWRARLAHVKTPLSFWTRDFVSPRGMLSRVARFGPRTFPLIRSGSRSLSETIEEIHGLAQAAEFKQVVRGRHGADVAGRKCVRAAQSHGEVPAVRSADNEIRIDSGTVLNDFDPLALETVARMGDCHESRTRNGRRGSVWRTRRRS